METLKICVTCHKEKNISDFYNSKWTKDLHTAECKECSKKRAKEHRLKNIEKYREMDRNRSNKAERVERHKLYLKDLKENNPEKYRQVKYLANKKWREKNADKNSAHTKISYLRQTGRLIPEPCKICGSEENVEAHHEDYSKPLDILWLCSTCHHKIHVEKRRNQ